MNGARRAREIFSLFGIPIRLDASWFILAALIVWSLAVGAFPAERPGFAPLTYWVMGIAGALGLFASILIHEACHALVARRNRIPMRGITLFVFGGVAEMGAEPPTAGAELRMAAAGPLASVALAALGYGIAAAGGSLWPEAVAVVIRYLALLNVVLAGFNLLPAFPLDGGRILRAVLWLRSGDLTHATRVASRLGAGFSVAFMLLGALAVLARNLVGGLWWILIGMFLRRASQEAYRQVVLRAALAGRTVRDFATPPVVIVPAAATVSELLESYVRRYRRRTFPVSDDGRLLGSVTLSRVAAVPAGARDTRPVRDLVEAITPATAIAPDAPAIDALTTMLGHGRQDMLVVDDGRLVGSVSVRDLVDYCTLGLELEPSPEQPLR
jgi:Zn-dependent protease